MLKFKLISKVNGVYIYEYYPDGDFSKKPGVVRIDTNTQKIKIIVVAEEDFMCGASAKELNKSRDSMNEARKEEGLPLFSEEEWPTSNEDTEWYYFADHMIAHLERSIEDGDFEEEGMVAWY